MQFNTPIEKFHVALQPVLREFARKSHALNIVVTGSVHQLNPTTLEEVHYYKANFYDPRFTKGGKSGEWEHEAVGTLQLQQYDEDNFVVYSRLIKNEKYKRTSFEYSTKTSKNITKVIKTLLDYVRPYSYSEIYKFHARRMKDVVSSWRGEYSTKVSSTFGFVGSHKIAYEEVKHLRDLGVQFKTPEYQRLAAEGIEAYEENRIRAEQPLAKYHVFIEDKRVSVTTCEEDPNKPDRSIRHLYVCDSIDKLADDVLTEVSLLKMLDIGKEIVGVGARVSERDYLVIKPLASATNA